MLPSTIVFAAFVSACACTLSARAEEPDSAKQLIGIMETVSGIAREAVPLAKQEFPLLDAKFKGDQYWSFHNLGDITAFKKGPNQDRAFRHSF